ncbi:MAG: 16S rRNA (guanine(527)-N(7))-methyltransferase RsmG [Spirochaetaceae bacterium]
MNAAMVSVLESGLDELGLYSQALSLRLQKYLTEIELWNPRLRLVDASGTDLVTRHILDSLTLVLHLDRTSGAGRQGELRLADLGSGAGLPGIPVALARPQVSVCLVERMERRCGFLRNATAILGLSQVEVCNLQTVDLPPRRFNALTARAYQPVDERFIREVLAILDTAGEGLFLRGRMDRTAGEIASLPERVRATFSYEQIALEASFLPSGSRHLLRIRHSRGSSRT